MTRTFPNTGEPFSGLRAAQAWCEENGHGYGPMSRGDVIGVHHVGPGLALSIPKWRGLSVEEQDSLDGQLRPTDRSYRTGGVLLVLTGGPLA